jgi:biopolymer transport protein ExbD
MGGGANIGEESDNPVEINATAMIDVTLCLCAFFMCSLHFKQLEGKVDAWLPKERPMGWSGGCCGLIIDEVRIFMKWDAAEKKTLRKIGNRAPVSTDAELLALIEQYRQDYQKAGRADVPIILDATENVPWQDVLHIVDLCNAEGLSPRFVER